MNTPTATVVWVAQQHASPRLQYDANYFPAADADLTWLASVVLELMTDQPIG